MCGFPDEMAPETWIDWDAIASALAAMAPLWTPGTANGYHPQTAGLIAGELIRRVRGRTIGEILRADYFAARGVDVHCGLKDDASARASYMPKPRSAPDLGPISDFKKYAFLTPWAAPAKVAREAWMAAELPASNMHATAKGLAEILHPLAAPEATPADLRLDPAAVTAALAPRIEGDDLVLPFHLTWAAGVMLNRSGHFGPDPSGFGHAGFGGSCVLIAPERRLTAAYVMNRMSPHLVGDPRAVRLLDALYHGLGGA